MEQQIAFYRPFALSAMRISLGLVIFSFGTAKIFSFHSGQFTPPPGSLPWLAGLIELIVGFFFVIGFQTRIKVFVLSGQMPVAYSMAHLPMSFFPTENAGYAAAVFAFVFFYFVFAGAPKFSTTKSRKLLNFGVNRRSGA
ncbi:DoxX family protein (plasmid) [Agrobacterium tumefaciens]|jgi:putative oxidoreductase|uniref:DoxX family protein n=1 Tax=Agrobacterium TaxID=357 RepID=UPI00080F818B|nr:MULTISPECIES: DoxX family protein [Agrobacterium]NSY46430.1 DoxX family protein [Agrobacterium tumefaciens]NSZ76891.1 DoxX family protein [Agrobacterium tumefaciens]NSZ87371.1 DoxX family protein [Agrobacterium tumefaciens]UZX45324.1 DoxX family protein [Agrobacterium sp. 13-2099-1-2]WCA72733.1 DoxX family protein [Agrobacterium tumefaciens]